jgi:beta-galactosidase/beta-glucuronidase
MADDGAPGVTRSMYTPWGEAVTPETAWREYPRPQLARRAWLNLNGLWQYAITSRGAPLPDRWEGEILVPFAVESTLSGVGRRVTPDQRLWYRREFELPADWHGSRIVLHFGAVDYQAAVWVNGGFVTAHTGGFDSFSADITDYLDKDTPHTIVVGAWDPSNRGEQPRGKQHLAPQGIWYTPVTGIWQTVWLEPVPRENHVAEVRIAPDPAHASVAFEVLLARPTTNPETAVRLRIFEDGREIVCRIAPADRRVTVSIPDPKPWSPGSPFLYALHVELIDVTSPLPAENRQASATRVVPLRGEAEAARYAHAEVRGAPLDSVTGYFGMRSIATGVDPRSGHPALVLNGIPEFHLATLDQGWWPDGLHTPPSDAAIVQEIQFLKAAGFNAIRKHIKIEPARYYYHCDRLGILVWQDMPAAFAPAQFVARNDEGEAIKKSVVVEQYELELRRMLNQLHVHPSVVVWVLHNEGWGQFDTRRLTDWIKALDPSRLVNAVSGWRDVEAGDLVDRHDYAEQPTAPDAQTGRVPVLGEYGGIGWPVPGHLWNPESRNWGYQTYHDDAAVRDAYARQIDAVVALHRAGRLAAAVYTQTSDVEAEVNGLLSYDRRIEKLPREWLRLIHAPLTGRST